MQFVEGRRTMPVITHFAGRDGNGWTPVSLVIDAEEQIKLGQYAANFVALANLVEARLDTIQQAFDAHIHTATTTATIGMGPAVGVITVVAPASTIGQLASVASSKVSAE